MYAGCLQKICSKLDYWKYEDLAQSILIQK